MDEEIIEEFNERFDTIEKALKYIVDSQAKSEFIHKRDIAEHRKGIAEIRKLQEQTQKQINQTQKHVDYITKVLRFNIEEYEFQEEKLVQAGTILSQKREPKI